MENVPTTGDIPVEKESKGNPWKKVWISLCVLLVVVLGVSVYEYFRITPYDVRFTNVTSSSVTVSWNTKSPTSATALALKGDTLLPLTILGLGEERFYDTRDVRIAELDAASKAGMDRDDLSLTMDDFQTEIVVEDMGEYYTHHVTITGLESETEYSFMVGDRYLFRKVKDLGGNAVVSTLQIPEEIKSPVPAYGTVKNANNQESMPIDELSPVTDAVIYFNYLDEFTGERSSVYSSSFNSNGNWYIDVSNAVGEDGRFFLERYEDTITNILVELIIDAGPFGVWKKTVDYIVTSPTELIVINDPLMSDDEKIGISRIDSQVLDSVVKGANAELLCKFANFCGPCYGSSLADPCACPEATLKARGCEEENKYSLQKAAEEVAKGISTSTGCSGNASPGDYVEFGEDCKQCKPYNCKDDKGNIIKCEGNTDESVFEYRWVTIGNKNHPSCADSEVSSGAIIPGDRGGSSDCGNGQCGADETFENCSSDCFVNVTCKGGGIGDDCFMGGQWGMGDVGTCNSDGKCEPRSTSLIEEGTNGQPEETNDFPGNRCVSQSCAKLALDDTYNLDDAYNQDFPTSGETISYGFLINDNCGREKVCYKENSVVENGTLTPQPIPTPPPLGTPVVQNDIPLKVSLTIPAGTQCPEQDPLGNEVGSCTCSGGVDSIRYPGEWCRQTKLSSTLEGSLNREWRFCKEGSKEGDVCWKNGNTCKEGINPGNDKKELYCNGAPPSSSNFQEKDPMELFSLNKDVKGVYAQEQGIQHLLDSETGMFVNLPLGVYVVEYEGETYSVRVDKSGEKVKTLLYIDTNKNGQYDEGVDKNLGEEAAVLNISPVELVYNYSLKEGFNFVAFPFLIQMDYDVSSAAALLLELNERYDNAIYSISKYDGRWKIVGQNSELYDANDFQLLPGQGYVIKAKDDVSITLTGQPVKYDTATDTAPITLFEGWNLIGLYGTGVKTYTAKSMVADINTSNFTADNVTKWARDKQMYEGFQFSEDQEYGFDFPINSLESYFVRILEGRGNWQPKLRTQ